MISHEMTNRVHLPPRPTLPSLDGLQAVFAEDLHAPREVGDNDGTGGTGLYDGVVLPFEPVDLREPTLEGHLLQNTLWPEAHKL